MGYNIDNFLYFNERRGVWDGALGKAMQIAGQGAAFEGQRQCPVS